MNKTSFHSYHKIAIWPFKLAEADGRDEAFTDPEGLGVYR